jgi:hypothetical protein
MTDKDTSLPWPKGDIVVTPDNVDASFVRWEAIKAMKTRTATPEQVALVRDCDAVMQEAMENR